MPRLLHSLSRLTVLHCVTAERRLAVSACRQRIDIWRPSQLWRRRQGGGGREGQQQDRVAVQGRSNSQDSGK